MTTTERISLAVGFAVVAIVLIGFVLVNTIGLHFILCFLPFILFPIVWSLLKLKFEEPKLLTILSLLFLTAAIIYATIIPRVSSRFTEFYLLGINNTMSYYPTEFVMNEDQVVSVNYGNLTRYESYGEVGLVITNREHKDVSYTVSSYINGTFVASISGISLVHEDTWYGKMYLIPKAGIEDQRFDFVLSGIKPLTLDLRVSVKDGTKD